jgi:hypothetical protein
VVAESQRSVLLHTDGLVQNHSVKILNTNISGIGKGNTKYGLFFSLFLNESGVLEVNNTRFENVSVEQKQNSVQSCFYFTGNSIDSNIKYSLFNNITGADFGSGMWFFFF